MQRFTPNTGDAFVPVDNSLRESLMLSLFQGVGEVILEQGSPTCQ